MVECSSPIIKCTSTPGVFGTAKPGRAENNRALRGRRRAILSQYVRRAQHTLPRAHQLNCAVHLVLAPSGTWLEECQGGDPEGEGRSDAPREHGGPQVNGTSRAPGARDHRAGGDAHAHDAPGPIGGGAGGGSRRDAVRPSGCGTCRLRWAGRRARLSGASARPAGYERRLRR